MKYTFVCNVVWCYIWAILVCCFDLSSFFTYKADKDKSCFNCHFLRYDIAMTLKCTQKLFLFHCLSSQANKCWITKRKSNVTITKASH